MNRHFFVPATCIALLSLAGCGSSSDDKPAAGAGTVNTSQAKSVAQGTVSAVSAAQSGGAGAQIAAGLQQAASASNGIITPSVAGTPGAGASALPGAGLGQQKSAVGTCDCTANACNYQACDQGGGVIIDGQISWGNGKLTATNLTYKFAQGATLGNLTITTNADLTYTATSIDGTLDSAGSVDLSSLDAGVAIPSGYGTYSWTANTSFSSVKYSGGTATSGSMHVDATYNIGGKDYAGSADVTFP